MVLKLLRHCVSPPLKSRLRKTSSGSAFILREYIFWRQKYMSEARKPQREERVKVFIRLRPDFSIKQSHRCVYLPENTNNQLVVVTGDKKEIFVFDHVAHQQTTQAELYSVFADEAVEAAMQGLNYCFFAYGQTGAGKTYSILGSSNELTENKFCQSRGILPRFLEQLFADSKKKQFRKFSVKCSYMEIYNENIFDLLESEKKSLHIRENSKNGVFVEGIIEKEISNYAEAIQILLDGEKERKIEATRMNIESSRSHAIFTIVVSTELLVQGVLVRRKSKCHIVDLAGSERLRHTNAQGERLREGCKINQSLHVLGNVINALVEAGKKKKHIPFRDSKLTYFLKDSLSGNSITKLLANVHPCKKYIGDTISTLVFAKRSKILKFKIEANQVVSDENFDSLRSEVRRLREELSEAKYFKIQNESSKPELERELEMCIEANEEEDKLWIKNEKQLSLLEANEVHYKALIALYEQHMSLCEATSDIKQTKDVRKISFWKNIENRNKEMTSILKNMPAFARICKENLLLKKSMDHNELSRYSVTLATNQSDSHMASMTPRITISNPCMSPIKNETPVREVMSPSKRLSDNERREIVSYYEKLIEEMTAKLAEGVEQFEKYCKSLEGEIKLKDRKIVQLMKRKPEPTGVDEMKDQNDILKLNILELEEEISVMQQTENMIKIELKESIKESMRLSKKDIKSRLVSSFDLPPLPDDKINIMVGFLQTLKEEAENEAFYVNRELNQMRGKIGRLELEVEELKSQNAALKSKGNMNKRQGGKSPEREPLKQKVVLIKQTSEKIFVESTGKFEEEQDDKMNSLPLMSMLRIAKSEQKIPKPLQLDRLNKQDKIFEPRPNKIPNKVTSIKFMDDEKLNLKNLREPVLNDAIKESDLDPKSSLRMLLTRNISERVRSKAVKPT